MDKSQMDKSQLAKILFATAHITGEFKLRSGQISSEYFDKYRFEADPQLLKEIAVHLAPLVPQETEVLAGLEMGGIPIATALAFETGLPVAFIRKQAKDYGTCQLAEGASINGKVLCLIEDVITTGGAVTDATQALRDRGASVNNVICVIYRGLGPATKLKELGLNDQALFTMEELKNAGL